MKCERMGMKLQWHKNEIQAIMKQINKIQAGDTYQGIVKIVRKAKPGPVILEITDGTGFIDAVSKECQFNTEQIVEISGLI